MRAAMFLGFLGLLSLSGLLCSPTSLTSLLLTPMWAQDAAAAEATAPISAPTEGARPGDSIVAWQAFRKAVGMDWKIVWNRAGLASRLSGKPFTVDAADRTTAARQLLARHATLFALDVAGMSLGTAREDRGEDGSSVVRFSVLYRDMTVLGAHVSVRFNRASKVASVAASTTPIDIRRASAGIDARRVQEVIAARHLEREIEYVAKPTLAVMPARAGGRLVYQCQVRFDPPLLGVAGAPPRDEEEPAVWHALVDASSGQIVSFGAR